MVKRFKVRGFYSIWIRLSSSSLSSLLSGVPGTLHPSILLTGSWYTSQVDQKELPWQVMSIQETDVEVKRILWEGYSCSQGHV